MAIPEWPRLAAPMKNVPLLNVGQLEKKFGNWSLVTLTPLKCEAVHIMGFFLRGIFSEKCIKWCIVNIK